jgi:hypothetical protein
MSNELPPFYVGQEVVCVSGHFDERANLIEGNTYTIKAIRKCCNWLIDVGIRHEDVAYVRCKCGNTIHAPNWFLYASRFAPKDQFKAITFTKVMETELVSQN